MNIIKHNKWNIRSIVCYPCNRVKKNIEDLVNDHVVEEEIASFDYSSGDSEVEDLKKVQLSTAFNQMSKLAREHHSFVLWQRLIKKLRGAVILTQVFTNLHKKMYLLGTPKKSSFLVQKKVLKPYFFILMPNSRIR